MNLRRGHSKGFTLVEISIALLAVSLGVIAFVGLLSWQGREQLLVAQKADANGRYLEVQAMFNSLDPSPRNTAYQTFIARNSANTFMLTSYPVVDADGHPVVGGNFILVAADDTWTFLASRSEDRVLASVGASIGRLFQFLESNTPVVLFESAWAGVRAAVDSSEPAFPPPTTAVSSIKLFLEWQPDALPGLAKPHSRPLGAVYLAVSFRGGVFYATDAKNEASFAQFQREGCQLPEVASVIPNGTDSMIFGCKAKLCPTGTLLAHCTNSAYTAKKDVCLPTSMGPDADIAGCALTTGSDGLPMRSERSFTLAGAPQICSLGTQYDPSLETCEPRPGAAPICGDGIVQTTGPNPEQCDPGPTGQSTLGPGIICGTDCHTWNMPSP